MELQWHTPTLGNTPSEHKPNLTFTSLEELIQATEEFRREAFIELALDTIKYPDGLINYSVFAVYEEGYVWDVVGFINNATQEEVDALGLPKWKAKYREVPKE